MLITTNKIQDNFYDFLKKENDDKELQHVKSGKLSASKLFYPTLIQLMYVFGVPTKETDRYALGLFLRGRQVENTVVEYMKKRKAIVDTQKLVQYKGAIGYVDAVIRSEWLGIPDIKDDTLSVEIKSVKNAKLKRIKKTGVDWHYQMQGAFYALAENKKHFGILIVSAEDYQQDLYIFETRKFKKDVDRIISDFNKAKKKFIETGELPEMKPQHESVAWAINPQYSLFDERFMNMDRKKLALFMRMKDKRIDGLSGQEELFAIGLI